MRKTIILALMAATAVPSVASAQSRQEVRESRQDLREEQRELRDAQRYGDRRDVREERRDVRDARREVREDWRDYRERNRNVYARGNWRAPWQYRQWNAGAQLRPNYYSSRYYVNDWNRYRLAAPGRNLRWVRNYDDVLLVNVRTGRVVEVHRNFFW
ncbi:RcnB family protein [Sphingobium subterraneum]|uniref:Ni/Co efflux regulator RcnB n=1 Tax=Sphingobium subterraneum TaxID=627688 RepID=A0A841J470_9SPHN|nr:RcnB family protein [Sphingobium subterraneum]MBB6123318.1 Ni/Co efflux regulator RcnB [Sphingobium subterraneum]